MQQLITTRNRAVNILRNLQFGNTTGPFEPSDMEGDILNDFDEVDFDEEEGEEENQHNRKRRAISCKKNIRTYAFTMSLSFSNVRSFKQIRTKLDLVRSDSVELYQFFKRIGKLRILNIKYKLVR